MEEVKQSKKRYILVSVIFILLALLLFLLPEKYDLKQKQVWELLRELNSNTRFVTTDYVAQKIINKEPAYKLIDVRNENDFKTFSLPGAINIPIKNILDKDKKGKYKYEDILKNDENTINIFYSNGTIYANQTLLILSRMNYKNNYVMKGGLNKWFETIINPRKPQKTAAESKHILYRNRKAYSIFFTGGGVQSETSPETPSQTPKVAPKKESPKEDEGGC